MPDFKIYQNVSIEAIHSAGKAVGIHGNKKIYIDNGIPGEIADLKVRKRQKGFIKGTIEAFKECSPYRTDPLCKHYHQCGGCNWMHIKYEHQLKLKKQILSDALKKYLIDTPDIPDVIPSPKTTHHRNKTEYAFSANGNILGFHPQNNPAEVFNVDECHLQREPSGEICKRIKEKAKDLNIPFYNDADKTGSLKSLIIRTSAKGETLIIVGFVKEPGEKEFQLLRFLKQLPSLVSINYIIIDPLGNSETQSIHPFESDPYLFEKIENLEFRISAQSFFQPNPDQAYQFYKKVKEYASLNGNEFIYDLYTGAGTIALFLAEKAAKIIGIEGSPHAIEDAKFNALLNCINNAQFIKGDILETFKPSFVEQHGQPDIIILDPPRSGTLIEIKKTILWSKPKKIIYVSCNPVSLAWDLKQLTEEYKVVKLQPFDAFPHTHHLETVVLLEK